ncbi:MAG: hypothetical protein KJO33_07325, partial [Gammaproteobacteria bacterium]|nr:hypothetical protein [Gammaproteobacteria bacterium]
MRPLRLLIELPLTLCVAACLSTAHDVPILSDAPFEPDSGSLLLHCGAVIDGHSEAPWPNQSVLIENGRITRVGPDIVARPGVPVLALPDHTCLPGLIDMHTHILESHEELVDLTLYYG